jgi:hypothetical protein
MVTGIRPGRPRNRADRGFREIQSFWRFSGVQSSALTTRGGPGRTSVLRGLARGAYVRSLAEEFTPPSLADRCRLAGAASSTRPGRRSSQASARLSGCHSCRARASRTKRAWVRTAGALEPGGHRRDHPGAAAPPLALVRRLNVAGVRRELRPREGAARRLIVHRNSRRSRSRWRPARDFPGGRPPSRRAAPLVPWSSHHRYHRSPPRNGSA